MNIIYKIQNQINKKVYVGQTTRSLKVRKGDHLQKLRKNVHWNKHLQSSYNKYGESIFVFKIVCSSNGSLNRLNKLEELFITKYDSFNCGYNQTEGGYNSKRSQKTRDKLSELKIKLYAEKGHHWLGKNHTQITKLKMAQAKKKLYKEKEFHLTKYKGKSHSQYNPTLYRWVHSSGIKEFCTAYDLIKKFDLNSGHISSLIKGKRKTHKGWKLYEKDANNI